MDKIILYTTHCPKCRVLEMKLNQKGITYEEVTDVSTMLDLGIKSAPMLAINGQLMDFKTAADWANKQ
jgi:glutaredoxin-related protein